MKQTDVGRERHLADGRTETLDFTPARLLDERSWQPLLPCDLSIYSIIRIYERARISYLGGPKREVFA